MRMHSLPHWAVLVLALLLPTMVTAAHCKSTTGRQATNVLEELSSEAVISLVQERLDMAGLYKGYNDGISSEELTQAIKKYQRKNGFHPDGNISIPLLVKLTAIGKLKPDSLHAKAASGQLTASIKQLSDNPALNAKDEQGWTPLHYAVLNGRVKAVSSLLKASANVDASDHYGITPLMVAVYTNRPRILGERYGYVCCEHRNVSLRSLNPSERENHSSLQ